MEKWIERDKRKLAVDVEKAQVGIDKEEIDGWKRDVTNQEKELAVVVGGFRRQRGAL